MKVKNLGSTVGVEVLDFSPDGFGGFGIEIVPVMQAEDSLHGRGGGLDEVDLPVMGTNGGGIYEGPACTGGSSVELGDGAIGPPPAILSECLVGLDGIECLNQLGRCEDISGLGGAGGDPPFPVISPKAGEGDLTAGILPLA